ncbi:MAG: hypothetical protein KDB79_06770, partial [Acidobacteria bacterium]|nr:hypothetical protein [Acidobacteriota bacterium]
VTSDYEGHSFIRQPEYLAFSFKASNEAGSNADDWLVGIYNIGGQKCKTYDEQQTCTTKYKPGSYISGMAISADLPAE